MAKDRFRSRARITRLVPRPGGGYDPVVLRRGSKAKAAAAAYCPIEDTVTRSARSTAITATEYLRLHRRSNRRNRAGWLWSFPWNIWQAVSKAVQYPERDHG